MEEEREYYSEIGEFRGTPLDENYGSCSKTHCELRIYPPFSPEEISVRLGIAPTLMYSRGDKFIGKRKRELLRKETRWMLSSQSVVRSLDVRHHVDWFLERLEPVKAELVALQACDGIKMTLYCEWWSAAGNGGPVLWPKQLLSLADLNLEFLLDVYSFGIQLKKGPHPDEKEGE